MLVLNRREKESIRIGRDIVITVVDVRGSSVRLAIDAPKEVSVHRQELYERLVAEEQQGSREERKQSVDRSGERPQRLPSGDKSRVWK